MATINIKNERLVLQDYKTRVSSIVFPDIDRETFKKELIAVADKLLSINYSVGYAPFSKDEFVYYLLLIKNWLIKLLGSYNFSICDEMSFCVKAIIEAWDPTITSRLVIFTEGDYSILKERKDKISQVFPTLIILSYRTGVTFNVILFHEIGHYVDYDNSISEVVFDALWTELSTKATSRIKRQWFPPTDRIDLSKNPDYESLIKNYIGEYVADIFGAQYAHDEILTYLSFIKAKHSRDSCNTHPSLFSRKEMVKEYLSYCETGTTKDVLLDAIVSSFPTIPKLIGKIEPEDKLLDLSLSFNDLDQMLSVFPVAWHVLNRESKKAGIKKNSIADYEKIIDLQYYKDADANIKRAIKALSNKP